MARKSTRSCPEDLKRFLFLATGDTARPGNMPPVFVADNLDAEIDRLGTLSRILMTCEDELQEEAVRGLGLILGDHAARMRRIVEELTASRSRSRC